MEDNNNNNNNRTNRQRVTNNNNPFMIDNNAVGAGIGLGLGQGNANDVGAGIGGAGIGGGGFGLNHGLLGDIGAGMGGAGLGQGVVGLGLGQHQHPLPPPQAAAGIGAAALGLGGGGGGIRAAGLGLGGGGIGAGIGGLGLGGFGLGPGGFGQAPNNNNNNNANNNQSRGVGESFLSSHFDRLADHQQQQNNNYNGENGDGNGNAAQSTTTPAGMRLEDDERRCAKEIEQAVAATRTINRNSACAKKSTQDAGQDTKEDSNQDDHDQEQTLTQLTSIPDMLCAQHALIAKGNVLQAMQRIHGMQHFKDLYQIDDSVQQGRQSIQELMDQQPGYLLDIDSNAQTHESTLVLDMRAFHPNKTLLHGPPPVGSTSHKKRSADGRASPTNNATLNNQNLHHNWAVLAKGHYYLNRACQPTLASVRQGLTMVLDCDGMEADKNVNPEVDVQLHAELFEHYPRTFQSIKAYNTASVANVWFGLCKRVNSYSYSAAIERVTATAADNNNRNNTSQQGSFHGTLKLGCKPVDIDASRAPRRMSQAYLPSSQDSTDGSTTSIRALEALQRKVLRRVQELLELREANEQHFELLSSSATAAAVVQQPMLPFQPPAAFQQQQQHHAFQNHFPMPAAAAAAEPRHHQWQ